MVLNRLFVSGAWVQGSRAEFHFIPQDPRCPRRPLSASATSALLGDPGVRIPSTPEVGIGGWQRRVVISGVVSAEAGSEPDCVCPAGFALQIQCYQCEEFQLNNDCSSPEFIVNCTVNVQDMCQKEVMEQSAGKSLATLPPPPPWARGGSEGPLNYRKRDCL